MAELRDIRNTGVVVGGDVTHSTISVGRSGSADGTDEAAILRQLDTLFADLFAAIGGLPAERAGEVASDTVRLKTEIVKPGRDPGRIRALLGNLTTAAAAAAPLAEVVNDITELVSKLVH